MVTALPVGGEQQGAAYGAATRAYGGYFSADYLAGPGLAPQL